MNLAFFDSFPEIETERLRLRALLPEDAPAVFEVFGDPESMRYYDADPMTDAASATTLVAKLQKRYADRNGIRWAIVEKLGGRLIGTIGFNSVNVSTHRAEIGYEVLRRAWGQGFATEAVRAVVGFGHESIGVNRIEASVMLGNAASVRVLRKVGFENEGILRAYGFWKGQYHDLYMFSILRPQATRLA